MKHRIESSWAHLIATYFAIATLLLCSACANNPSILNEAPGTAFSGPAGGQGRLVALLITDNTDHQRVNNGPGSIATGIRKNAEFMEAFFQKVRSATGMTVDVRRIVGTATPDDPFTCNNIVQTIRTLPVSRDDAVMVYYSGHGFNIGTTDPTAMSTQIARYVPAEFQNRPLTQFPFLACGTMVNTSPSLDMIAAWLSEKQPRLTIVMADACNSFEGGSGPSAESFFGGTRGLTTDLRLRSLFVEARGTVLITGSARGHYSYYDNSALQAGGVFTKAFLSALGEIPASERTTWQDVGRRLRPVTVRVADSRTGRITTDVQSPFLNIGAPFATAVSMPR
ncbi:MAG: hypothetical protein EXR07_09460 [Acetobacteraceae bacterium]|nr:hypothetical protein [Acetobacteraceae bacterium]